MHIWNKGSCPWKVLDCYWNEELDVDFIDGQVARENFKFTCIVGLEYELIDWTAVGKTLVGLRHMFHSGRSIQVMVIFHGYCTNMHWELEVRFVIITKYCRLLTVKLFTINKQGRQCWLLDICYWAFYKLGNLQADYVFAVTVLCIFS